MSSSVALSTGAAGRPAFSQLVAAHTAQTRNVWCSARSDSHDKTERISRRIDKYQRHPLTNIRRKTESRQDWPSTAHRAPSGSAGWGSLRSRSSFSDFSAGREHSFWDAEREQMQQRMTQLKKHITTDPYGAIFGRSVEPYHNQDKSANPLTAFLQSFMNTDKFANSNPMGAAGWQMSGESKSSELPEKGLLQDFNFAHSESQTLEYDPITGRMSPKSPNSPTGALHSHAQADAREFVDCPPGSEVEAKFVSNPTLVEDGQFQPAGAGDIDAMKTVQSEASVDCPPGSELEAHFVANPASIKDAHIRPVAHQEAAHKPDINIACSAGNELEALFISDSIRTQQPRAETFKVQGSSKVLNADAGLESGRNVECAPGSELEAMFMSNPASRLDQSRPVEMFGTQSASNPAGISVECPPGNELDAKFASEATGFQATAESTGATVDCAPGNEVEAKILADSVGSQAEVSAASIDCPPGNELEAKFVADPTSAEEGLSQPELMADPGHLKRVNMTQDCAPGSELGALFTSDAASVEALNDSESLQAGDIRARYASFGPQVQQSRPVRPLEFEGSEDRVGDFLQSQAQGPAAASYRILAYDSSTSQVTTAEADSFFGAGETVQPTEILSRLHNPAKFVPFFDQMQREGYDIATGGGDILVFRRARGQAAAAEQEPVDPLAQAEIAKFIRHDSFDLASLASQPSSTTYEPLLDKVETSQSQSESSVRRAFRRMFIAGSATAATCYAIGVVIEYFRTGGQDGLGIDAFTAFESERRRRD
ncbi:hypothetical protein NUU61_005522 [Penicillium alfredii]|uniref:Uncharacterized protein n=1 Tax=Penicillium alfredii TaxID=1506179 RepID=A0A9W9K897_9EURO|nr:uncharacterized protein NUU61_005522 [Penicillium alfredii]KAJ5096166.1 hypothetical protein NUU61_005522 [Penicillium alfredii]